MTQNIRWGILSTGKIAHSFATDLRYLPDAELAAGNHILAEGDLR
jgi:hypothetical protein